MQENYKKKPNGMLFLIYFLNIVKTYIHISQNFQQKTELNLVENDVASTVRKDRRTCIPINILKQENIKKGFFT